LVLYKGDTASEPLDPKLSINRVDMWHFSVIADYRF